MTEKRIRDVLDQVAAGRMTPLAGVEGLGALPCEDLGFAKIDSHRSLRRGVPEVIFGEGKPAEQLVAIGQRVRASNSNLIITRLSEDKARAVTRKLRGLKYHADARIGTIVKERAKISGHGAVTVLCAGTSDIPVAEEAALCADLFGNRGARINDVGVAGIHRLTANLDAIREASVIIVVAGMEGALPSVVAGAFDKPVVSPAPPSCFGGEHGGVFLPRGGVCFCSRGASHAHP